MADIPTHYVVVLRCSVKATALSEDMGLLQRVEISRFSNSSYGFPLNDLMYPFSQGMPCSLNSAFLPSLPSHSGTVLAQNLMPVVELDVCEHQLLYFGN